MKPLFICKGAGKRLRQIITLLVFSSAISGCSRNGDMYITSAGFKGKVTVIYEHPEGIPVKYIGKRQAFEISSSGVLKTKGSAKQGIFSEAEYFYRKDNGELVEMREATISVDPLHGTSVDLNTDTFYFAKNLGQNKKIQPGENVAFETMVYSVNGWD